MILEQHMRSSRQILAESVVGLNQEQRRVVEGIYNELRPLIEASLDPKQINQLFGEIEKTAAASGANRTVLGKGVDVAKKANEVIDNVGRWLQNTKPVQAFDQKFENLKNTINKKFPDSKILDAISKMGFWAKENPGKTAAIIGVLTAIASLAGGPVGGAIAGQILRGSVELLKGEKLSTAVGKGVKTALLGYLSGAILDKLGSWLSGLRAEVVPYEDGLMQVSFQAASEIKSPGFEWTRSINLQNITVLPDDRETIKNLVQGINDGDYTAFEKLYNFAKEIRSPEYKQAMLDISSAAKQAALDNDLAFQALETARKGIVAAAQGGVAAAGAAGKAKKESVYVQTRPLSEGQVYLVFGKIQKLNEGPMDWIKKGAEKLTTRYTADTLNAAWQKAGSPTDSEELRQFLVKQGVDQGIVDTVYDQMKIPKTAPNSQTAAKAETLYAQVKKEIQQLNNKDKKRIAAYLQKQLGTA